MTRNAKRVSQWENLVYTSLAPHAILENLEKDGYQRVVLAGGARINTLFAEAGLIDEVLVTITPMIFGERASPCLMTASALICAFFG